MTTEIFDTDSYFDDYDARPQGAFLNDDGSVTWRTWSPRGENVKLAIYRSGQRFEIPMRPVADGYFEYRGTEVTIEPGGLMPSIPGIEATISKSDPMILESDFRYKYLIEGEGEFPDVASRYQPDGVHGGSALYFPSNFPWTDHEWKGVCRDDLAIYELHVGTFTPEGTFAAAVKKIPQLLDIGFTAIEIMPIAQFPGERNWGYDGVFPYAAQNSYGGPIEFQKLIDAAHRYGMAVILDVVYNHFGPEGCYFDRFGPYFTHMYHTPWGPAINYDAYDCDHVRKYIVDNAMMWVRDFHCDGLRLDAVQMIFDLGARHLLAEVGEAIDGFADAADRPIHVISETDQNDTVHVEPREQRGYGLAGMWSDDFHHAMHAWLTGEKTGYYRDFGTRKQIAGAIERVFFFDGIHKPSRRRRFGGPVGDCERSCFVTFNQNHDQVGNRPNSDRLAAILSPEALRMSAALLLLSPCTPLVFMGEEFAAKSPFPFFCSFETPGLNGMVRRGRRLELRNMHQLKRLRIANPSAVETFESARLSWPCEDDDCSDGISASQSRELYRRLLDLRKDIRPQSNWRSLDVRLDETGLLTLEYLSTSVRINDRKGDDKGQAIRIVANLTEEPLSIGEADFDFSLLLSTEAIEFGGNCPDIKPSDQLCRYELRVLAIDE